MKKIFCLKSIDIFLAIKDLDCISKVAKKTGIIYSHICNTLKIFEENKLIEMKTKGRERRIKLTQIGKEIQKLLEVFEDG